MATFRYVGNLQPTKDGNYRVRVSNGTSYRWITFNPGEDFTVTDETEISQLEFAMCSWTKEFEYVRVA